MMNVLLRKTGQSLILAGLLAMPMTTGAFAEGDAAAGEKVFKRCKACHKVGPKAKNAVGPALNGIVGIAAGSVEGYKYGTGIIEANGKGLVWNEETLSGYLEDPKGYIVAFTGNDKAKVKMRFKLKKEEDRKNVIAYLATFAK